MFEVYIHIWLITIGEPLPWEGDRLLRAGILSQELIRRGHRVTWWTSAFDHSRKSQRTERTQSRDHGGCEIVLLRGCAYRSNVSLRRVANHRQIASEFRRLAARCPAPDIALCSMPTIELSCECVRIGKRRGFPVVLDVRDLWPDAFVAAAPAWARLAVRAAITASDAALRRALRDSSAIWAVSENYLVWALRKCGRERGSADSVHLLGYESPSFAGLDRSSARASLAAAGITEDEIVCWFVGTFGLTYDFDTIIGAASILRQRPGNRIRFVLSGAGERAAEIEARADAAGIVLTGWVGKNSLRELMVAADIGLACYVRGAPQGIPNKIGEYLCAGLPIANTLAGETADLLAEAGCGATCAAGSPQALAKLLVDLASDRERLREMSRKGRAFFDQRISATVVYPAMAAELERLACAHPALSPHHEVEIA